MQGQNKTRHRISHVSLKPWQTLSQGSICGAAITAQSEKLGSQERAGTNKSEFLLFKVLSDVNVIFLLMPTFSDPNKAVLAFYLSSPSGPSTTCTALAAPNPFLLPLEPLSWVSELSSADEVY